ncbi:VacJ family lipoprotein [Kangiella sp. TOML190]|uniref:MlaA family lipoprotein n=1 Tax=Kangiella sp. TOML190 TaxID=2931351 RepID=UPI00203CE027|nr:VacJ family lipoprotein [Kangiella sp. TOML190]
MKATILSALFMSLFVTGCATTGDNPQDPYESFNRSMWEFNKGLDKAILRPVAKGYKAITPDPVEKGVTNFFNNIDEVPTIINDVLQFKFGKALKDTGRFLINSTLGVAGLFDPATDMGLEREEEDFGQTLAVWGFDSGAYLMLPFFGPSSVRDGIGSGVQATSFYSLYDELNDKQTEYILKYGIDIVQTRAAILSIDEQLESAPDDYTFLRDVYLQNRKFKIYDGNPPIEDDECEFEEDCEEF